MDGKEHGIPDDDDNKRGTDRRPVLRTAKVMFSGSVLDCIVLDESSTGMRVSSEAFVAFPETVTVELRSGSRWTAHRRWQRGQETGLELIQFAGLTPLAAVDAAALYTQLRNAGAREVTSRLGDKAHFGSPDLKHAAEAVDDAIQTLERVLRSLTMGP